MINDALVGNTHGAWIRRTYAHVCGAVDAVCSRMLTYAEQEVINDALIGNTHEAWITSITPGNALFRPF